MFIAYTSEDGNNVTVSPRLGTGHSMPSHTDAVQVELLSGSGIINNTYVVKAKCSDCRSWSGGNADVLSDNQKMLWALGRSGDIKTNALDASIQQHQSYNTFSLDFKQATGDAGVPVLDASDLVDNVGGIDNSGNNSRRGIVFHAFLMVAAFLVVFPCGFLFLRVFEKLWLHWAVQSFALLMITIGTGVGIAVSKRNDIVSCDPGYHSKDPRTNQTTVSKSNSWSSNPRFCHPRRRTHGVGSGSDWPSDFPTYRKACYGHEGPSCLGTCHHVSGSIQRFCRV